MLKALVHSCPDLFKCKSKTLRNIKKPQNECPHCNQDVNHSVRDPVYINRFLWTLSTGGKLWLLAVSFCVLTKTGSWPLHLSAKSRQPIACQFCKNIRYCQAAGFSFCPLTAALAHWSHHWKQKHGHRSDLVGLFTPLFPSSPLFAVDSVVFSLPFHCSQDKSNQSLILSLGLEVRLSRSPYL